MTKAKNTSPASKRKRVKKSAPHDELIKKALENELTAREFFEEFLPAEIKKMLDLSTIEIQKESFVESSLKKKLSDVIYYIKTKDNDDAFVLSIIEHQSTPDYWVSFRIMKYSLLLLERYIKGKNKLPVVIPMVLYNGKSRYTVPKSFWELFDNPSLAEQTMPNYKLIDLQATDNEDLNYDRHISLLLYAMKNIHAKDMIAMIKEAMKLCKKAIMADKSKDYIHLKQILCYIDSKVAFEKKEALEQAVIENLPKEDEENIMRTIADYYIEQGEARGIKKGEARGVENRNIQIATKMFQQGLDMKLIADVTGLPTDKLLKIKSETKIAS